MSPRADFLGALHAADEHLAALAPGAHLEARIRARLRGHAPSSRGPFGGSGLRVRPIALAFAVAAIAIFFLASRPRRAGDPDAVASSPSAAPSAIPDRISADAGPSDLPDGPRLVRPPRMIHAPALDEDPPPRKAIPIAPLPSAAPSIAPSSVKPPDPPAVDPGSAVETTSKDVRSPATPRRNDLLDAPLTPVMPSGTAPASTASPRLHGGTSHETSSHTPSSPSSSDSSGDDPDLGCRSPEDLAAEAAAICKAKGQALDKVSYLGACSDGRFRGVDEACAPVNTPSKECQGGELGNGVTCNDSTELKTLAFDLCQKNGMMLTNLSVVTDGCPGGGYIKASYECCPAAPPSPPTPCTGGIVGDGVTCQDYGAIKQQASDICAQSGAVLTDLGGDAKGCPDGQWKIAKYACCGPGPSPSPDPCTYSKVGDGLTCQDPKLLDKLAEDACTSMGLSLVSAKVGYDCAMGQSTWAEIACCPSP